MYVRPPTIRPCMDLPAWEARFGPLPEPDVSEIIARAHQLLKGIRMPKMRAKLTIQSVTDNGYNDQVKFTAQYSENKEDNSYSEATPSASADFTISNKALRGQFKPGQKFYVDFTPIES